MPRRLGTVLRHGTHLTQDSTVLWALSLSLVPFLLLSWLLRKLLGCGISALERRKVDLCDRSVGL